MMQLKLVTLGLAMGATRGVLLLLRGWLGPFVYGETFINIFESVYPGFTAGFVGGLIGAFWGFLAVDF